MRESNQWSWDNFGRSRLATKRWSKAQATMQQVRFWIFYLVPSRCKMQSLLDQTLPICSHQHFPTVKGICEQQRPPASASAWLHDSSISAFAEKTRIVLLTTLLGQWRSTALGALHGHLADLADLATHLIWISWDPEMDQLGTHDGSVLEASMWTTPASGWKSSINGWKSTPISRPQFQKCLAFPVSQATVSTPFRINIALKDVASERKQQDEDPFLLEEEEPDGRAQAAQQGCWILWNDLS